MNFYLALLFSLLATTALAQQPSGDERKPAGDATIVWYSRTPEQIARLGKRMGHGDGTNALAYPFRFPCAIATTRPPHEDSPIAVLREYIRILRHERRHCREGAWHRPNLRPPGRGKGAGR